MMVCRADPRSPVAWAAGVLLWLATALVPTIAAAGPSAPADVDFAEVARDVFQDQRFWWKRIEPRPVSTSWLQSILTATLEALGRILKEIVEWLVSILQKFFSIFSGFGGVSSGGAIVVWVIVAVVLAWSIWKLGPAIVSWLRGGTQPPIPQGIKTSQTLAEASDLFEQAAQAYREGMHAEAIRLALLALIARLEKLGLLRYDPTRTNREYQMQLRHISELAACFGRVAWIYERVWYGRMPAGRADAELALEQCGSVIHREDLVPE